MNWKYAELDETREMQDLREQLSAKFPYPPLLVNLLWQRGLTTLDQVKAFLKPELAHLHDPFDLRDMETAVERLLEAIRKGERILLYGDYDVDGTTSVTLMKLFFKDWGLDYDYYIPDREKEGYGLSIEGIDTAVAKGCKVLLTLDCGAKAEEKLRYAHRKGLDVIVVDHHLVGTEAAPCVAMVNPRHPDCTYPFKELSACALALKLAQALCIRFPAVADHVQPNEGYDVLDRYADLVALSVACDIVPLVGENRVLVSLGLQKLRKNPLKGIAALMALAPAGRPWEVEDLVFFMGPRINSAGRLYSAHGAVQLLMGQGPDTAQLADDLQAYNQERKSLDAVITQEALEMIAQEGDSPGRASTVLWNKDWHKGVIGIVASRLIERHYRPTILLTQSNGKWVGSGRSVEGFDLYAGLEGCTSHLLQFGGHKHAAGLTLEEGQLVAFREAFEAQVQAQLAADRRQPVLEIAAKLELAQVTPALVRHVKRLGPFGPGNLEPVFAAHGVEVQDYRNLKGEHVFLKVVQGGIAVEAIGFFLSWKWKDVDTNQRGPLYLDIAFQPDIKIVKDHAILQLKLKDFRPSFRPEQAKPA